MALALAPAASPLVPLDAIIFDVDGVLWDTRLSYDRAICATVDYVMEALGREDCKGRISHDDLRVMRRAGSLNSDWDLTYVLTAALLAGYEDMALAAQHTAGRGAAWAHDMRGPASRLEFDIIKRWFDLVYWGTADFARLIGGTLPSLPPQPGTWHEESPFISVGIFAQLQALGVSAFGIATGRPWLELSTVLDNSDLDTFIPRDAMCTADILHKPDPQVIHWCTQRMRTHAPPVTSALFCGDTRDDLQLVLNYRMWPEREAPAGLWLGAVSVVPESEFGFFLEAGATACIDHIRFLPAVAEKLNRRIQD